MLNNVKVKRLVEKCESERADRLKITDERLLEEAAKVVLSNRQDCLYNRESMKALPGISAESSAANGE